MSTQATHWLSADLSWKVCLNPRGGHVEAGRYPQSPAESMYVHANWRPSTGACRQIWIFMKIHRFSRALPDAVCSPHKLTWMLQLRAHAGHLPARDALLCPYGWYLRTVPRWRHANCTRCPLFVCERRLWQCKTKQLERDFRSYLSNLSIESMLDGSENNIY